MFIAILMLMGITHVYKWQRKPQYTYKVFYQVKAGVLQSKNKVFAP
jgi:hypothetical protein